MRISLAILSALSLIWPLTACTPSGPTAPTAPAGTRTPAPTAILPSPTPTLQASFDGLVLNPGLPPNAWTAMGILTNHTDLSVQGVGLQLSMTNNQGELLERANVGLALPLLGPGSSAPFAADFKAQAGTQVEAQITGYRNAPQPPLPIDITLTRRTATANGALAVLGSMSNPNASPIEVIGSVMVALDADNRLVSMSSDWLGVSGLASGEAAPFLALLPTNHDVAHLESYTAATALDVLPSSDITLSLQPTLQADDQGNAVVLAEIHNRGVSPGLARVLVTLLGEHGPTSAALYTSPIPLAPDEDRPFALTEFPGLVAQLASGHLSLNGLQARALIDTLRSQPSEQAVTPLKIEITAYETIGGNVLVHGIAHNQGPTRVMQPTVIGALRSTSGDIWSAGEITLGAQLAPGSQRAFLLAMPRPAGIEPSQGEFDIRGLALSP